MAKHKFDIRNIERLSDPKRLEILDLKKVISHFKLKGNITLVDVGTGAGIFAESFLKLLPEARCYALDIKQEAIDWIKENSKAYKEGRLIPELMKESKTQLGDNIADFLFMITLHHELEEPIKLLKECRRILKKGGKLLIADWKKDSEMGPPRDHRIDVSDAIVHLKKAEFADIATFNASKNLFCIGATKKRKYSEEELHELISKATVDCYSKEEAFMGVIYALKDNLSFPFKAKALGDTVDVIDIDDKKSSLAKGIITVIKKKGKKYAFSFEDLEIEYKPENEKWFEMFYYWLEDY